MSRMVIVLGVFSLALAGCATGLPLLSPQPSAGPGLAPSGCQTVYQYGSRYGWGSGTHCQ